MRPYQGFVWGGALALVAMTSAPAQAGWNNVFQVCCNNCGSNAPAPVVSGYSDPCPTPCPQTQCTTRYVQRSYYQPVTSYKTSYYYEPVTTYRTSYYYEPVTSYRYSCYYDPCTCRYQQVAQPVTNYQLRSRCCPVTSYLQRTCMTPVTTYQQSFYYEPVTTCCTTSTGAPVTSPPPGSNTSPGTTETREPSTRMPPPPPGTEETRDKTGTSSESLKPVPRSPSMPPAVEGSYRPQPRTTPIRPDRIASLKGHNFEGRVQDRDRTPQGGVRILLVNASEKSDQYNLMADGEGQVKARLPVGGWLVYTYDGKGKPVFSRRIEVPRDRVVTATLTSR